MNASPEVDVTRLLRAWENGEAHALEELIPLIHDALHKLARRYMKRERGEHTLQTTALVNEVYLRLVNVRDIRWGDRVHFFAVSARIMRCILVDLARSKRSHRRGGARRKIALDDVAIVSVERNTELLALDQALERLAGLSPRQSQVVEMRYFGGLNETEIARVLKVSERTVRQDWSLARVWLFRELGRAKVASDT